MDQQAVQRSRTLEAVAGAIARWTVDRHEEVDRDLPERYGSVWRDIWSTEVAVRLGHLAQALAVRRPALFEQAVAWSRDAFVARGVPEGDLRTSLACMGEVVTAELPPEISQEAVAVIEAGIAALDRPGDASTGSVNGESTAGELALRYLEAVLDGRPDDAETLILATAASGTSVADIYTDVLQPAQAELGRLWHRHEITVADEHLATVVTGTVMARLRQYMPAGGGNGRRVLTCTVGGDLHEIAVRMVSDFFQLDGWSVICLGANLPREDVAEAVARHAPDLVALSTSTSLHVRCAGELVDALRAAGPPKLRILVGGGPFNAVPDLWREIGADAHAVTGPDAVRIANALIADDA